MPRYSLRREDGSLTEVVWTIAEYERRKCDGGVKMDDGSVATQDFGGHFQSRRSGCATWPMWSDAAGVAESQAREAYEHSVKNGVPTEFCPKTGRAKFTSAAHRKRYCELVGLYDRSGGYSDPRRLRRL